jgi:hypothetical protein
VAPDVRREDLGWEGSLATLVQAPGEHVFVASTTPPTPTPSSWTPGRAPTPGCTASSASGAHLDGDKLCWVYVLDG